MSSRSRTESPTPTGGMRHDPAWPHGPREDGRRAEEDFRTDRRTARRGADADGAAVAQPRTGRPGAGAGPVPAFPLVAAATPLGTGDHGHGATLGVGLRMDRP